MAVRNYTALIKEIEKGLFSPIYLFYGQETYLIEEATEKIFRLYVDPNFKDFSYRLLYADEESLSVIIDEAKTLPFMGNKKILVIKNIDRVKKEDDEIIINYCLNPSQSSCVIFTGEEIDRRRKFFHVVSKKGIAVRFDCLSDKDLDSWIKKKLEGYNLKISEEALSYLKNFVGNDLRMINNELEKAVSFVGEKSEIRLEDIEAVSGDIHFRSIFELTSSIGWKKEEDALRLINKILLQGESPLKILALISYQIRSIMLTKFYLKKRYSLTRISKELGIPQTFLKEYIEQSKIFQFRELRNHLKELLNIDIQLKSSKLSPKILLESLILKMCALPSGSERTW